MAIPKFTLTAGAGFASRIGVDRAALAGARLTLKSNVKDGQLVVIDDGLERVEDVTVTLDDDGKINGDLGVELLADDASLDLDSPLKWQVTVSGARSQGFSRSLRSWWIDAGLDGATVDLSTAVPAVGTTATGLIRGPEGPEGPQGPQGPQGPVGATGPAGSTTIAGISGLQGALDAKADASLLPVQITQAAYDALGSGRPARLYAIVG